MCYVADGSGKPSTARTHGFLKNVATKACEIVNLAAFSFVLPACGGKITELKHLSACFFVQFLCLELATSLEFCDRSRAAATPLGAGVFQDAGQLQQGSSSAQTSHSHELEPLRTSWRKWETQGKKHSLPMIDTFLLRKIS